MELDLQNPFTISEDLQYDGVQSLFANESDHMPSLLSFRSSQSLSSIRRRALALLSQVKFSYNLDPFLVYLSVNYVDRFLSKQEILMKKPWIAHILVVASLSLAAKMTNSDLSISLSDLQREEGFEFESQSVRRMETILLASLHWRMRSITPFSFLQYFLSLIDIGDSSVTECLKHQASDIIFNVQHELKFLEYKPSVISASALLCAIQNLTPIAFSVSKDTISSCEYVSRDSLLECIGAMEGYEPSVHATASGTVTPISVLQWQLTRSSSEEDTNTSGFPESDNVDIKRRRLNGFCESGTFQISQIQHCLAP